MASKLLCSLLLTFFLVTNFILTANSIQKNERQGHGKNGMSVSYHGYDDSEIHGYHFHTYFFQKNSQNRNEAVALRRAIQKQIDRGVLKNCRLNHFNSGPVGPHPVGSYETCCNKTSISPALSWFMQNHGNLSILLHPLTRYEVIDHTHRAMFLGKPFPLDVSVLSEDLEDNVDLCLPIN